MARRDPLLTELYLTSEGFYMLRSLIGSRAGRRLIAVLVIAILVIASLAIYLQASNQRNVKSLTKPAGAGQITGLPDSVNLTTVHSWSFPLQLVVSESYVSGVILNITANSTYTNAEAYFGTTGGNWKTQEGNLSLASTLSYYTAGNTDSNLTLDVQGNANASGWIGISITSALGKVTPGFQKVTVYGYKEQQTSGSYIRFNNLPATLDVNSSSSGNYNISYTAVNVSGGIQWTTNVSWVTVTTLNSTIAEAVYTAPDVSVNTTYVVNITATSGNGVTNSSTLTFVVTVPPVQPAPSISFDNLPATLTVRPGETGTYIINYTAINVTGGLTWQSNESWLTVTTVNSTTADANYTAPVVVVNSTYPVNISVTSGNGAANSSTLTFDIVVAPPLGSIRFNNLPATLDVNSSSSGNYNISYTAVNVSGGIQWTTNVSWVTVTTLNSTIAEAVYTAPDVSVNTTYVVNITATSGNGVTNSSTLTFVVTVPPVHPEEIKLLNLPATITVQSNSSGTFIIQYEAIGTTGGLVWNASVPWVTVTTVNSTTADANYTAPSITPCFGSASSNGQYNETFVVGISVTSGNGVSNSSTLTFVVTTPYRNNTTSTITTLIYLNSSELEFYVNGGIHINIVIPSNESNSSLLLYTVIVMNNSELEGHINGGIHINVYSHSSTNLTIYAYTMLYLNNSTVSLKIKGGLDIDVYTCSRISVSYVPYTMIESRNSTVSLSLGCHRVEVTGTSQQPTAQPQGDALSYQPFFTEFHLNHSKLKIKVDGGIHLSFSTLQADASSKTAIYTYISLNHSKLEIEVCGGVFINLLDFSQDQVVLSTDIQLNNSCMEIELHSVKIPSRCGAGDQDGSSVHDSAGASGKTPTGSMQSTVRSASYAAVSSAGGSSDGIQVSSGVQGANHLQTAGVQHPALSPLTVET